MFILKKLGIIKKFQRNDKGTTAVEFAFIGMPFFVLLFSIVEASLYFFAGQVLENAVSDAARMVRTGQFKGSETTEDFRQQVCDKASVLFRCEDIKVFVQIEDSFSQLNPPQGAVNGAVPTPNVRPIFSGSRKV